MEQETRLKQGTAHFAAVHKVFGASNVSKLLLNIPANRRLDAVITICYEAQARLRDPVYGCVAHIFALQQQGIYKESDTEVRSVMIRMRFDLEANLVVNLQAELSYLHGNLGQMEVPHPPPPPAVAAAAAAPPPVFSIAELPATGGATAAAAMPVTSYDLSSLFEPMSQPAWAMQQRGMEPRHYMGGAAPSNATTGAELPHRNESPPTPPSSSNASPSPSLSLSK
ncbi:hypothetical protein Fmac_018029 [Flemingia macrophylla]|uniref:LOB domain-containing protein n=1 Tax=Flemingia macrophylla TaxID=520843 RepID=A0ABD1M3V1_9FABA